MKTKYSSKVKQKAVELYKSGVKVSEISSYTEIPRSSLYAMFKNQEFAKMKPYVDMKSYHELEHINERLRKMVLVLQSAPCSCSSDLDDRISFIKSSISDEYTVNFLCETFRVSKGTYYNRLLRGKGEDSQNAKRRKEFKALIEEIYNTNHQIFGAGKITAILKDRGYHISEATVADIMHQNGWFSIRTGAKKLFQMNQERKQNILNQNFIVDHPNEVWVSDVTFYCFHNISFYICVIIDLFARKVIGYHISKSNNTHLLKLTFKQAFQERFPDKSLIFHSDQGANYTSRSFRAFLKERNIEQSFSRGGVPYDNSVCESFFGGMKRELLYRSDFKSEFDFKSGVDNYILFYNNKRPHTLLRYMTPDRYEAEYYRNQCKAVIDLNGSNT